jgi:FtsP/CotA-like multicopper oxidase with cupredoxin domain
MRAILVVSAILGVITAGCATPEGAVNPSGDGPFAAADLPALAGQRATCAGPGQKSFTLDAREVTVDLGMGMRLDAWVYNGKLPGPTLEACEGDRVTIDVTNHAETWH